MGKKARKKLFKIPTRVLQSISQVVHENYFQSAPKVLQKNRPLQENKIKALEIDEKIKRIK